MWIPGCTSSTLITSLRYGPMRQYCSGGSSTWSSIQPESGVWSSGWFNNNKKRPPDTSTRAASARPRR